MSHHERETIKMVQRVRKLRGQLDAIERSLTSDGDCGDQLMLLAAVRGGVNALMGEVLETHIRFHLADGSKEPYDRTRRLVEKLAVPLKATPLRISIVGHTAAGFVPTKSDYGAFDLSADRANTVRQILEREGLPAAHIFAVSGKADTQPLFPDDPSLSANRRVTITLMREDPALPPDLKP